MLASGVAAFLFTYLLYGNQTSIYKTSAILTIPRPSSAVRDLTPWSESHGDPFLLAERELLSHTMAKDALLSLGELSSNSTDNEIEAGVLRVLEQVSMNIDRPKGQIELVAVGSNRDLITVYANAIGKAFVARIRLDQTASDERLTRVLRDKIREHSARWETAEAKLVEFRASHFRSGVPADFEAQTQLRNELSVKEAQLKEEIGGLEDQIAGDTRFLSPEVERLEKELNKLMLKRSELAERFTDLHPEVEMVSEDIQQLVMRMEAERNAVRADRTDRLEALIIERQGMLLKIEDELSDMNLAIASLPKDQARLADLERDRDLEKDMFEMFSAQMAQMELLTTTRREEVALSQEATMPKKIYPKEELQYTLSITMALLCGFASGFLWEMLDNSIKSIDEVEISIGAAVIGVVPNLVFTPEVREDSSRMPGEPSPIDAGSILLYQPRHPVSEAYRSIATSLEFAFLGEGQRSILFTSAVPSEGKTATVSNTATALAHTGKRVLMIDANLRKPDLTTLYNLTENIGLYEVMNGRLDVMSCVYPTSVSQLYLLPAGRIGENPVDLLRQTFGSIMGVAVENFDAVIVDCPPVLPVADTNILASMVDGCVVVYNVSKTPENVIAQTKNKLQSAKCEVIGVVLNRIKREGELGNYYYNYYYADYSRKSKSPKV